MAKKIAAKDLVPGKQYRMAHSRKGSAIVECVTPYDDGGAFVVVDGKLRGIQHEYGPGDEFQTVNNLATFEEVEE